MYEVLKEQLNTAFSASTEVIISAPGRTEIGGNHTDHQHGKVLAASVELKSVAAVCRNQREIIRVLSQGYPMIEIALDDLQPKKEEEGTSSAIVRGVAAGFAQRGVQPCGFDACVSSNVLAGSGLSSSASFEILMGTILNFLTQANLTAMEIAKIGQNAENRYFGKPCGLLDQAACAVGGLVSLDFQDPANPKMERLGFDFEAHGYDLCIIDTGANHADLTDAYAAIPNELKALCKACGEEYLRDLPEEKFVEMIPMVRKEVGDRAVLRAMHIYEENRRVDREVQALKENRMDDFFHEVKQSGDSSWKYLQNVIAEGRVAHQEVAFGLAMTERLLEGEGAFRVHGGGFAGTIQAYVPKKKTARFCREMNRVLGDGACHVLAISPFGGRVEEICMN